MAVIIQLTFPVGRYHATPWGRHVNEGVVEWPPSPWRFLRALVAVWKRTAHEIPENAMLAVLQKLSAPPQFCLPPHRIAHTRHYMPWEKKGPQDRTLVLDTFVVVSASTPILFGWRDVVLNDEEQRKLTRLLSHLGTLGRAESWVEATLVQDGVENSTSAFDRISWNCLPQVDSHDDVVRVLCADEKACFSEAPFGHNNSYIEWKESKAKKAKKFTLLFPYPSWSLCLDTEEIHAEKYPTVPGAVWINYTKPEVASAKRPAAKLRPVGKPTILRFVIDGPVSPRMLHGVQVGEAFRRASMGCFRRWCEAHENDAAAFRRDVETGLTYSSPILAGKSLDGTALTGQGHAHYLPLPHAQDARYVGEVVLYARDGIGDAEWMALAGLRTITAGRQGSLRVGCVGYGRAEDLPDAIVGPAVQWRSLTPYLGHDRIGMHHRVKYLRKGLRREWNRLREQIPEYADIELLTVEELSEQDLRHHGLSPAREYQRAREGDGGREAYRAATHFRLVFSAPVTGPLALGYASHFGMGLFVPVKAGHNSEV